MKKHASRTASRKAAQAAAPAFVDDYLAALLGQASKLISTEFHQVVRRNGLQVSEWRILASLAGGAAIAVGRLAELTLAQQPSVTRQLDRMQHKGLVRRLGLADDRRITLAQITPVGQRLVDDLIVQARAHERLVLAPLGVDGGTALKRTLREIIRQHRSPGRQGA